MSKLATVLPLLAAVIGLTSLFVNAEIKQSGKSLSDEFWELTTGDPAEAENYTLIPGAEPDDVCEHLEPLVCGVIAPAIPNPDYEPSDPNSPEFIPDLDQNNIRNDLTQPDFNNNPNIRKMPKK